MYMYFSPLHSAINDNYTQQMGYMYMYRRVCKLFDIVHADYCRVLYHCPIT